MVRVTMVSRLVYTIFLYGIFVSIMKKVRPVYDEPVSQARENGTMKIWWPVVTNIDSVLNRGSLVDFAHHIRRRNGCYVQVVRNISLGYPVSFTQAKSSKYEAA